MFKRGWRRFAHRLPQLCCVFIIASTAFFAADAPWGGDDVVLVASAVRANREHRLITAGLGGSFGYPYGPIPSQIYQLLAMFSHDPVMLVRLHAVLLAGTTAVSLLLLADVMNLSRWYAPLAMLGPFFWFYSRLMWDNTFAIPVGTLLLAAYGSYLRSASRAAFFTAVACAVALPLIHPMTLPLVIPVAMHALIIHRVAFRKYWKGLIVIAVCAAVCSGPYVKRVAEQVGNSPALIPPRSDALSRAQAAVFPLFAGRLFTARGFFDDRGPELGWEQNRAVEIARQISAISYPLIWLGMFMAIARVRHLTPVPRYSEEPGSSDVKPGSAEYLKTGVAGSTLPSLCLTALILQGLMDARLRISPYPHYYCGTWAAGTLFLWIGLDVLKKLKLRIIVAVIYGLAMALSTLAFALDIHRAGGGKIWYGPSLGSQLRSIQRQAAFTGE